MSVNVGPKVGDLRRVGGEGDRLGSERSSVDARGSPIVNAYGREACSSIEHSQYDRDADLFGMISADSEFR